MKVKNDPFASIKIAEYRNLMAGRFLFIMGLRMLGTLVGWWIYELTNDPFAIGLIGLSEVIPAVTLALYAGHIIDVSEKSRRAQFVQELFELDTLDCPHIVEFCGQYFAAHRIIEGASACQL